MRFYHTLVHQSKQQDPLDQGVFDHWISPCFSLWTCSSLLVAFLWLEVGLSYFSFDLVGMPMLAHYHSPTFENKIVIDCFSQKPINWGYHFSVQFFVKAGMILRAEIFPHFCCCNNRNGFGMSRWKPGNFIWFHAPIVMPSTEIF